MSTIVNYQPSWWRWAGEEKCAAAVRAAQREFPRAGVMAYSLGLVVVLPVGQADPVCRRRLEGAVEYACVDIPDDVLEMKESA